MSCRARRSTSCMKTSVLTRVTHQIAAASSLALLPASVAWAGEIAVVRNGFAIRHEHHAAVGVNTRLFLDGDTSSYVDVPTAEIEHFEKDATRPAPLQLPPSLRPQQPATPPADLNHVVNSESANFHLDPDVVNSGIHAESGFNSRAVSRKGARGLMQLMPGTANKLGVGNPFDPQANVNGGSRYLRELLERYNFDLVKALAAYN